MLPIRVGALLASALLAGAPTPARPNPALLAEGEGRTGAKVRVEVRDGLKVLTLDGEVQGAVPAQPGEAGAGDPLVALALALRPQAKTALVIGLGTGRTAGELVGRGLKVETVEIEPLVVEYARAHFGYAGHAVVADGLEYLKSNPGPWDLLLLDAFSGGALPAHLVEDSAIALMHARVPESGLIAVRAVGSPSDEAVRNLADRLSWRHEVQAFGSGVGAERQNLYLVAVGRPVLAASKLPAWPVALDRVHRPILAGPAPAGEPSEKPVKLAGYLIRARETGELCLDLPHWEMGAIRYVLEGPEVERLGKLLPSQAAFPTEGDIRSDGPTGRTLKPLLGGGGVMRSDTRFSSVAVALEGVARLRAVVHPDSVFGGRPLSDRHEELDRLLPYGGVLYALKVERVAWTLDAAAWAAQRKRMAPHWRKAEAAARKGDLAQAAAALEGWLGAMEKRFADATGLLPLVGRVQAMRERIAAEAARLPAKPSDFELAAACDRSRQAEYEELPDAASLSKALKACSEAGYAKVAFGKPSPAGAIAAARLYALSDDARVIRKIESRYGQLEPAYQPPDAPTPP